MTTDKNELENEVNIELKQLEETNDIIETYNTREGNGLSAVASDNSNSLSAVSGSDVPDEESTKQGSILQDILNSFKILLYSGEIHNLVYTYVYVPVGCLMILCFSFITDLVITKGIKVKFPSSVALMLVWFIILNLLSLVIPKRYFLKYVICLFEIPANFSLKWINLFFLPAFVSLPLAEKIGIAEVFIIAGIFVFGYVILFAFIAYLVVGLQKLANFTKIIEKEEIFHKSSPAEETMPELANEINISHISSSEASANANSSASSSSEDLERDINEELEIREAEKQKLEERMKSFNIRSRRISQLIVGSFDWIVYILIFIVGIPVYFACNYSLLLYLSVTVLIFKTTLKVTPGHLKKYIHPILVSFPFILLFIFLFCLMKYQTADKFLYCVRNYKTGTNYLNLFDKNLASWPGAGDFLSSMMDISIVSLSLPMYNYRHDLRHHFTIFIFPILIASFGSFFAYPPLCRALNVSPQNALGFTGRSVTLALGTPMVTSLKGSVPLMSVCTIVSGILGVICGDFMLHNILRIRKDDFMTIGITMGINCGAISTAHLLTHNPRAAAMSSLSFSIFGTIMVILAAITPLADVIQRWAGLVP